MRQRFTVIEGGAGRPDAGAVETAPHDGPPSWSIELLRPNAVPDVLIAGWRGLLTRLRVPDPVFADPDYLLPVAQHQAHGSDLVFAFALAASGRHRRLEGVVALVMPHPFWGRGRAKPWHPPGLALAPALHPDHADAIRDALNDSLRDRGMRVDLDVPPSLSERTPPPMRLAQPAPAIRRDIPATNLLGIRPTSAPPREAPWTERIAEPGRIRDAVEEFLGLDARVSPRPIVDDPSESALVRVVTRLFAQRRQATVEIVRRADRVIAVRLLLGHGPQGVVWKEVRDRCRAERETPAGDRITG